MKKANVKKVPISVRHETIRVLQTTDLRSVVGALGDGTASCPTARTAAAEGTCG